MDILPRISLGLPSFGDGASDTGGRAARRPNPDVFQVVASMEHRRDLSTGLREGRRLG